MKYKWLNRENNKNLIIFFNGWGMDENIVKHLACENYDVLMFYDYNTIDTDFNWNLLNIYIRKNIIAWSMGVMVASKLASNPVFFDKEGSNTAINGTLKPIDEKFGIHPRIYDLTIKGFNEKGREKFVKSMFDGDFVNSCSRDIENQRSELVALKNYKSDDSFKYDKVLISDNDKIIPTKSQVVYWGIEPNLKAGHCPFFQFKKWRELL